MIGFGDHFWYFIDYQFFGCPVDPLLHTLLHRLFDYQLVVRK